MGPVTVSSCLGRPRQALTDQQHTSYLFFKGGELNTAGGPTPSHLQPRSSVAVLQAPCGVLRVQAGNPLGLQAALGTPTRDLLVVSCLPEVHSNTAAVGPEGGHFPGLFQILCGSYLPGRKEPMSSGHQQRLNPSPSLLCLNISPTANCFSGSAGLIPPCS